MTSVAAVVAAGAAVLRDAGLTADDATTDAGVLARHLLSWTLADWLAHKHDQATPEFAEGFTRLIHRRTRREPVAYLTGVREFYGRTFGVRPGVLIPRPETELLIDVVLEATSAVHMLRVLDIGTGSGCVAITIALERADARVTATDISADALTVARANAAAAAAPITLLHADLYPPDAGPWDVIVSNPPYIPDRDRPRLAPDVRDHEPALALFGGSDGLDTIRRIVAAAPAHLAVGGRVCLEVGIDQQTAVTGVFAAHGFADVRWQTDLQGIPRVVSARLPV